MKINLTGKPHFSVFRNGGYSCYKTYVIKKCYYGVCSGVENGVKWGGVKNVTAIRKGLCLF